MKSVSRFSKVSRYACLLCGIWIITGCEPVHEHQDLVDFMEETKRRPKGQIEPLPTFHPYQPFNYAAMTLRSPFEKPMKIDETALKGGRSVQPDFNRAKEYLESFNIAQVKMVGSIVKNQAIWVLMDTGAGEVVPVTRGNYLGLNHGRIVSVSKEQVEVLEIISDGSKGWLENPRIIKLVEKE
jgi:type IV pilus assembly protein PilP